MEGGLCASEKDAFSHKYDKKVYIYGKKRGIPLCFSVFFDIIQISITMGEKQDDADFVR